MERESSAAPYFKKHTFDNKPIFSVLDARIRYKNLLYAFDWVVIITAFIIGGIVFHAPLLFNLLLLTSQQGCLFAFVPVRSHLFRLDDPDISYPVVPQHIPSWALALIAGVAPLLLIGFVSLVLVKSPHDFHHGVLGLAQSICM